MLPVHQNTLLFCFMLTDSVHNGIKQAGELQQLSCAILKSTIGQPAMWVRAFLKEL